MKQFVVIGMGRFGSSIAKTLSSMGHNVLAIDTDEEKIQELSKDVTHVIQADATDENVLKAVGISNFDVAVVTIGNNIQSSILITLLCKEMGVNFVITKALNDLHAKVLYKTGADKVMFPEREMGVRTAHNLVNSSILDYIELAPDYSIIDISSTPEWWGKTLIELKMRDNYGLNVIAIKSGGDINISPGAFDLIKEGDVVVVIGKNEDISTIAAKNLGKKKKGIL